MLQFPDSAVQAHYAEIERLNATLAQKRAAYAEAVDPLIAADLAEQIIAAFKARNHFVAKGLDPRLMEEI